MIRNISEEQSGKNARNNIRNKMYTQINSGIGIDCCPDKKCYAQQFVPKKQRHKHGKTESIRRMAGYESVSPAAITKYRLHHIHKVWMMSWAETVKQGFANAGSKLIA